MCFFSSGFNHSSLFLFPLSKSPSSSASSVLSSFHPPFISLSLPLFLFCSSLSLSFSWSNFVLWLSFSPPLSHPRVRLPPAGAGGGGGGGGWSQAAAADSVSLISLLTGPPMPHTSLSTETAHTHTPTKMYAQLDIVWHKRTHAHIYTHICTRLCTDKQKKITLSYLLQQMLVRAEHMIHHPPINTYLLRLKENRNIIPQANTHRHAEKCRNEWQKNNVNKCIRNTSIWYVSFF